MNMTLSKRGDYVMRSAIALARAFDTGLPRKIREVVADTELPRTFASQILADLVRAGLAVSKAGRDGGYRLARRPEEISVLEVVEAAEGPLRAERCALGDGPCRWESVCPLHETWVAATARLNGLLAETSLAELAARDAAIEAGRYETPEDSHRSPAVTAAIADAVHVELPASAVDAALSRQSADPGWLAEAAAATGVLDGAASAAPATKRDRGVEVTEWTLDPVGRAGADGTSRFLVAWRLTGPAGWCELEGELSVLVVDEERSEVQVAGAWRQHGAGAGGGGAAGTAGAAAVEEAARRTLRRYLRQLARRLEEVDPSHGGPPAAGAATTAPAGAAAAGAATATAAAAPKSSSRRTPTRRSAGSRSSATAPSGSTTAGRSRAGARPPVSEDAPPAARPKRSRTRNGRP